MTKIKLIPHNPGFDTAQLIGGPFDGYFVHPAPDPEMIFIMFDPDTCPELTVRHAYRANLDTGNYEHYRVVSWEDVCSGKYSDETGKRHP